MKVAIIGCGIAGMSAGIALQNAGIDTVIFERNSKPGGVLAVYEKNGLEINSSMEFIYGTKQGSSANAVWNKVGAFIGQAKERESFITYSFGGNTVNIRRELPRLKAELISLGEGDEKRVNSLVKTIERFKDIDIPLSVSFEPESFFRLICLIPKALSIAPAALKYALQSCGRFGKGFKGIKLKSFFVNELNNHRSMLQYIITWALFSSGDFGVPANNQKELVDTLLGNYLEAGGEVRYGKRLEAVSVKNGAITSLHFGGERCEEYDNIIFACDPCVVAEILKNHRTGAVIDRLRKSNHVVTCCRVCFEAAAQSADTMPEKVQIPCKPFEVGTRIADRLTIVMQADSGNAERLVLSVTLYQENCDYTLWKEKYDADRDGYISDKNILAEKVRKRIEKQFPNLQGKLITVDIVTPVTYHNYTGAMCGGWMSEGYNPALGFTLGRSHLPGIKNASLAGQFLYPIGGAWFSAFSGLKAAERLIKLHMRRCEKTKT